MEQQIKFRGKRLDNGEWVYGYYVHLYEPIKDKETHRIYTGFAETECNDFFPDWYEVDSDTVGQFIGLNDLAGKEIYTDDIVNVRVTNDRYKAHPRFANDTIVFKDGRFRCGNYFHIEYLDKRAIVIGNIHDNPELLKGGEK